MDTPPPNTPDEQPVYTTKDPNPDLEAGEDAKQNGSDAQQVPSDNASDAPVLENLGKYGTVVKRKRSSSVGFEGRSGVQNDETSSEARNPKKMKTIGMSLEEPESSKVSKYPTPITITIPREINEPENVDANRTAGIETESIEKLPDSVIEDKVIMEGTPPILHESTAADTESQNPGTATPLSTTIRISVSSPRNSVHSPNEPVQQSQLGHSPSQPSSRLSSKPPSRHRSHAPTSCARSRVSSPSPITANLPRGFSLGSTNHSPFEPHQSIGTLATIPIQSHVYSGGIPLNGQQQQQHNMQNFNPYAGYSNQSYVIPYQVIPNAQEQGPGMAPQRRQSAPQHMQQQNPQQRQNTDRSPMPTSLSNTPMLRGQQSHNASVARIPAARKQSPHSPLETPAPSPNQNQVNADTRRQSRAIEASTDLLMNLFGGTMERAAVVQQQSAQNNVHLVAILHQKEAELQKERDQFKTMQAMYGEERAGFLSKINRLQQQFKEAQGYWMKERSVLEAENASYSEQINVVEQDKIQLLQNLALKEGTWDDEKKSATQTEEMAEAEKNLGQSTLFEEDAIKVKNQFESLRTDWEQERKSWEAERVNHTDIVNLLNEEVSQAKQKEIKLLEDYDIWQNEGSRLRKKISELKTQRSEAEKAVLSEESGLFLQDIINRKDNSQALWEKEIKKGKEQIHSAEQRDISEAEITELRHKLEEDLAQWAASNTNNAQLLKKKNQNVEELNKLVDDVLNTKRQELKNTERQFREDKEMISLLQAEVTELTCARLKDREAFEQDKIQFSERVKLAKQKRKAQYTAVMETYAEREKNWQTKFSKLKQHIQSQDIEVIQLRSRTIEMTRELAEKTQQYSAQIVGQQARIVDMEKILAMYSSQC